ncbi:cation:proton antiporter [Haloprofundus halophilus]|uniref:cation:proton antiporter n=1 Tax=Haloprofundus halophilus TaxID=2283527 RepID=UPI000E430E9D|nr:cation:proton antiporter [Haloprofundus halophilus]
MFGVLQSGPPPFATDFAIIIATAVVLSYVARLTGQPTIVAYIFTGLVLGPVFLDVVTQSELVVLMSELGLGFLLFLIGMKMRIDDVREILRPIINVAVWQTILQTALAFVVAYALGFTLLETTIIALATVFGATPIIVKLLSDKDELATLPGKIDIGVLIIQDIYLVILLAVLSAESLSNPQEIVVSVATILALMSGVGVVSYLSARYLLPTLFRAVADDSRAFFVVGIAWAFVFIVGTERLDLSLEVGAFLAGLSLAQVPYTSELTERIRPITDFFMVVFFTSIGLRLAADNLLAYWVEALVASAALMVGNFLIIFYLIDQEKFTPETSFVGSLNMSQVSEFSLVVGALAVTQGFIDASILGYLSLMAIVTMSLSTYLINYNYEIYERVKPYLTRFESEEKRDVDLHVYRDHAVVVGYDEIIRAGLPLLQERFGDVVVVDRSPAHAEIHQAADYDYIYGDFKHGEIRSAAGLKRAGFVLSSTVEPAINRILLAEVGPETVVFAEANSAEDAAELYEHGAHYVVMSTVLTSEKLTDYLRRYVHDPDEFWAGVERDIGHLRWIQGDTDG